jgi:ribonuclease-3
MTTRKAKRALPLVTAVAGARDLLSDMLRPLRTSPYRAIEQAIGHRFKDRQLLETALTHRSYRFERNGSRDNQRLEFLGDAALSLAAAACLYETHADGDEGHLTATRSRLTSGKALAEASRKLGLGGYLLVGKGEESSGGRDRESNLEDVFEAVVGAVYLDGGMTAVIRMFRRLFGEAFHGEAVDALVENPKGLLQAECQRRMKINPRYRILDRTGPAHASVFHVEVVVGEELRETGSGRTKQEAERSAARAMLTAMGHPGALPLSGASP